MKLDELIRNTDVLTYSNALKVTMTEIKEEISTIEELAGYINESVIKVRKLARKADGQYRLIAKLAQDEAGGLANSISIEDDEINEEARQLMEGVDEDE